MTETRDVVLVTIDSLRADRCGFLGSDRGLTPDMDRLAEEGLIFENAIAPGGATSGSTASFMTGAYPIDRPTAEDRTELIRQHLGAAATLPETFGRRGYRTAAITANPWTSRHFGYQDGFDDFEDFMDGDSSGNLLRDRTGNGPLSELASQLVDWWRGQEMYLSWDAYYDRVRTFLDDAREGDDPFFLWIFLVDVHMPYLPPSGFRSQSSLGAYAANAWLFAGADPELPLGDHLRKRLLTAYDDTVRFTDRFVGRLADELDDDTVLCVHADHGESFGEEGHYGHGYLYEKTVHVPLFVTGHPAGRIERPISLRALPALLPALAGGEEVAERDLEPVATSRNDVGWRLVHGGGWRYMETPERERLLDESGSEIDDAALLSLARRVTRHRRETEAERQRVMAAAEDVTRQYREL
jgi:arylsulfatase A-like enzyme